MNECDPYTAERIARFALYCWDIKERRRKCTNGEQRNPMQRQLYTTICMIMNYVHEFADVVLLACLYNRSITWLLLLLQFLHFNISFYTATISGCHSQASACSETESPLIAVPEQRREGRKESHVQYKKQLPFQ